MQARVVEQERGPESRQHQAPAAPRGGSAPATPSGEKVNMVSDDVAIAMLARDGWVEHVKEGG